ncbi:hypothetical protein BYT27DRAFT_7340885 [Phlegmacium glaucopus]|nr:hypothetical protein BYT27DRAFT_7340885 [Phlegmacium glaucopus]
MTFVVDLPPLFALMTEIKAAIVGSVVWNIMTADNVRPRDLNIVVPNISLHGVERLKALLSCSGSTIVFDGPPSVPYVECADHFIKLIQSSGATITITLAKMPSIVPVVISSPFTSQFNILTSSCLYCFYPGLLSRQETVRGMATITILDLQRLTMRGLRCLGDSNAIFPPCGDACLPVWRRTEKLEGVAVMAWGGYQGNFNYSPEFSLVDDLGASNFKWRLGIRCLNSTCPNNINVTLV